MKNAGKKKKGIIIGAVIVVIAVVIFCVWWFFLRSSGDDWSDGYIDDGTYIDVGANSYFNGIIEPQQTWDIQKDDSRTVSEIFVAEGDLVTTGQQLFTYDTSETSLQIQQAQIELEGIQNEISGYDSQIKELQNLKKQASADQQLEYTTQIQQAENSQKQSQLSLRQKQAEIDNLNKTLNNSIVTSTMDGVVKQINTTSTDSSTPFMRILATGAYQVKGTVDEQNVGMLSEGMDVIIHSRVNEDQTWEGTISKIDTENTVSENSNSYYSDSSSGEQATKYYFYVTLTTGDDLLLGQHVYVEPQFDYGDYEEGDIGITVDEDGNIYDSNGNLLTIDEDGNFVDEDGNIVDPYATEEEDESTDSDSDDAEVIGGADEAVE